MIFKGTSVLLLLFIIIIVLPIDFILFFPLKKELSRNLIKLITHFFPFQIFPNFVKNCFPLKLPFVCFFIKNCFHHFRFVIFVSFFFLREVHQDVRLNKFIFLIWKMKNKIILINWRFAKQFLQFINTVYTAHKMFCVLFKKLQVKFSWFIK